MNKKCYRCESMSPDSRFFKDRTGAMVCHACYMEATDNNTKELKK